MESKTAVECYKKTNSMNEIEEFIIERMEDKPTLSELYGGEVTFGFAFVIELVEEYYKSKEDSKNAIDSKIESFIDELKSKIAPTMGVLIELDRLKDKYTNKQII